MRMGGTGIYLLTTYDMGISPSGYVRIHFNQPVHLSVGVAMPFGVCIIET